MKNRVYSRSMKNYYDPDECIRIVNVLQASTYWLHGCYPEDIYPSRDLRTGQPITVYVFHKEKTKPLFEKWMNYELK